MPWRQRRGVEAFCSFFNFGPRWGRCLTRRLGRFTPHSPPGMTRYALYRRLSRPQDHGAAGRVESMKNSNYTIGSRTCDLPVCSSVPQRTAPPHIYATGQLHGLPCKNRNKISVPYITTTFPALQLMNFLTTKTRSVIQLSESLIWRHVDYLTSAYVCCTVHSKHCHVTRQCTISATDVNNP